MISKQLRARGYEEYDGILFWHHEVAFKNIIFIDEIVLEKGRHYDILNNHSVFHFIYVIAGTLVYRDTQASMHLKRGESMWLPSFHSGRMSNHYDKPLHILYIGFKQVFDHPIGRCINHDSWHLRINRWMSIKTMIPNIRIQATLLCNHHELNYLPKQYDTGFLLCCEQGAIVNHQPFYKHESILTNEPLHIIANPIVHCIFIEEIYLDTI